MTSNRNHVPIITDQGWDECDWYKPENDVSSSSGWITVEPRLMAIPTFLYPFLPVFGGPDLPEHTDVERRRPYREYAFGGNAKKKVLVRLPADDAGSFDEIIGVLRLATDPLAFKVLMVCLRECDDGGRNGSFIYFPNRFLDALGYEKANGYHQSSNARRVEDRLTALSKIVFSCRWSRGEREISLDEPLIHPHGQLTISEAGQIVARGTKFSVAEKFYADVKGREMFALADERFLRLPLPDHRLAIKLYPAYVVQWRMGFRSYAGVFKRNLGAILRDAGESPDLKNRHLSRLLDYVRREHDVMAREGLLADWAVEERGDDPLQAIVKVTAPEAVLTHLRGIKR